MALPVHEALPTPAPTFAASSWRALGTYVQLVVADAQALPEARRIAVAALAEIDRACSRFRADSDLVRANAAAGSWVRVSPLLVRAVQAALRAAHLTDGLVDPTLGGSLLACGYDADLAEVIDRPWAPVTAQAGPTWHRPTSHPTAGWRDLEVDAQTSAVRVPHGLALDLGATAKAFAADFISARIASGTGTSLVLSLGGDVATASPEPMGEKAVRWVVDISETPDQAPQERVELTAALATSSTRARRWRHEGRVMHHLLDPRTGAPVPETYRTVSVVAESCLAANTASTAALVLGDLAPQWLQERSLAARLVDESGTVSWTGGWPRG